MKKYTDKISRMIMIIVLMASMIAAKPERTYADSGYVISIPATINVNTDQSIAYVVTSGYKINVSVTSANGNKLKNGSAALSYAPNATSWNNLTGSSTFIYCATLE